MITARGNASRKEKYIYTLVIGRIHKFYYKIFINPVLKIPSFLLQQKTPSKPLRKYITLSPSLDLPLFPSQGFVISMVINLDKLDSYSCAQHFSITVSWLFKICFCAVRKKPHAPCLFTVVIHHLRLASKLSF